METAWERKPGERLLIVNADDFGLSLEANQAIMELLEQGAITSASLMVPGEKAEQAAEFCKSHPGVNVGIHWTLTRTGLDNCRPVYTEYPLKSLLTKEGYFFEGPSVLEKNAKSEEVLKELEAQIQLAISWGVDPTHVDSSF